MTGSRRPCSRGTTSSPSCPSDPFHNRSHRGQNGHPVTEHEYGFSTRAIRAGQAFDPTTGAVVPPIYMTSTFVQDGIGGFRGGYEYARGGNPTRDSLQELLAALEGGDRALSFASGLAAEDTLLRAVLQPTKHIVMGN